MKWNCTQTTLDPGWTVSDLTFLNERLQVTLTFGIFVGYDSLPTLRFFVYNHDNNDLTSFLLAYANWIWLDSGQKSTIKQTANLQKLRNSDFGTNGRLLQNGPSQIRSHHQFSLPSAYLYRWPENRLVCEKWFKLFINKCINNLPPIEFGKATRYYSTPGLIVQYSSLYSSTLYWTARCFLETNSLSCLDGCPLNTTVYLQLEWPLPAFLLYDHSSASAAKFLFFKMLIICYRCGDFNRPSCLLHKWFYHRSALKYSFLANHYLISALLF